MGRLRNRPRTPPTGEEPLIWKPKTPMIPEADIPEGQNPVLPEPPSNGITVDSDIPEEPGRPRPSIPWEPGTPVTERQRTPRVRTQQNK
ncbi:MAG TPA: hypothetical protein VMW65_08780 [Chloroflexota bacterium]|nr:hypothetical protein [Chloroflexota bacterium]